MTPTDRLTIYKASAGSGKTYTLTQEYLRRVLRPGAHPRHILAITFTNAATADMKRKIMETLTQILHGEYTDWPELLSEQEKAMLTRDPSTREKTEENLRTRADTVLQTLLHRYQDFSVKTIDSFVQNLIKPFAFELGLPRNYTPNIEIDQLSTEITERLIDECGRPGKEILTGFLSEFLQSRNEKDRSLNLNESIRRVVGLLFSEGSFEALESMKDISSENFRTIIGRIRSMCGELENAAARGIAAGKKIVRDAGLEASHFHEGGRGLYAWFGHAEIGLEKIASPSASIRKCVEKGILKDAARNDTAQQLLECFRSLENLDFTTYNLLQEIGNSIYALALVNRADEILDDIRETTAVIPISEFNKRIDQALSAENNDFIFERSGSRYHHIFIDEFQDTSRLQWKNLKPLVENNIAQGNGCLIVGDPKQSIYRFRNADLEQFVDLCEGRTDLPVSVNELQSNWRSVPGIIAFNNLFYRFIKENYRFSPGYEKTAGQTDPSSGKKQVRAEEKRSSSEENRNSDLARTVFKNHEQYYQKETRRLPDPDPQAVRICLARNMGGEPLEKWYLEQTLRIVKSYAPGDVAILCRKNRHCKQVADYLVSQGIKVSTPDSLILSTHDGLKLIIASLRYIDSREEFYKAEAYFLAKRTGLWPGGGLVEIPGDLYGEWKSRSLAARFAELVRTGLNQADIYDTVEAVIRFWKMERYADQYILTFLDHIQREKFNCLSDLTDWWEERADSIPICPARSNDSVSVMSIHKSKGLEFKIVIMPFVSDSKLHSDEVFWTEPGKLPAELQLPTALVRYVNRIAGSFVGEAMAKENRLVEIDNLNALYVATTRPREKLFLICAVPGKKSEKFGSADAIARFVETYPEYLETEEDGSVLPPADAYNPENEALLPNGAEPEADKHLLKPVSSGFVSTAWRSRLTAAAPPTEANSPEIDWGNFMHRTLSGIETAERENILYSLSLALNEYPQFDNRKEEAIGRIEELLQSPQLKPCFDGSYLSKTETGIAVSPGETYIPDRVLLKDKSAIVLDYKTGGEHKKYADQVANYMEILRKMGIEECRGFLVYLGPEKISIQEIVPFQGSFLASAKPK